MIRTFYQYATRYLVRCFPGSVFRRVRNSLWRAAGFSVAPTANLQPTAVLIYGDIIIGANTFIGEEVMITGGRVRVGQNCDIAPRTIIHAGSHDIGGPDRRAGRCYAGEIVVGDGTWIGANCTIVDGARIGRSCIIAAGSVVIGEIPDSTLAAGVPAVVKKHLADERLGEGGLS